MISSESLSCCYCNLCSIDDGNGKSTPIKRGPGRPRKRKYFGASCKGDKLSPVPTADENKEGDETPPASRTQTPEPNAAASESESLVSKDSEPPKKKKKKTKQSSNPVEQEGRATAIPILGMSPVELTVSMIFIWTNGQTFTHMNKPIFQFLLLCSLLYKISKPTRDFPLKSIQFHSVTEFVTSSLGYTSSQYEEKEISQAIWCRRRGK